MTRTAALARRSMAPALLTVLLLASCRAELPTPIDPTIDGRYELRTINGRSLPFTRTIQGGTETTESGFLEFEPPVAFRSELRIRVGNAAEAEVLSAAGIWLQYESGLQLTYNGTSLSLIGQVSGDRITVRDRGDTFVFEK